MLNYLRITIRKVKVINENNTQTFNLKIDLFKQAHEIEKLSSQEIEINKSFFWEMPMTIKQDCLEITAISKTLYFFDSLLAKVSIPINISKLNDASEWYYLKNNKNENIIGVLISMYYDSKEKSALGLLGDSSFIGAAKNFPNKADISCDILKTNNCNTNHLFLNIINRTGNVTGINNSVDNIKLNAQSQFIENNNNYHNVINESNGINNNNRKTISNNNNNNNNNNINDVCEKSNMRLDTTIIYNDYLKSPDNSLTNNLFSPFSCRFENDKINLNLTNVNSKFFSGNNSSHNYYNVNKNNSLAVYNNAYDNLNNFSAINNKNNVINNNKNNILSDGNRNNYNNNSNERQNFNNLLEISDNKITTMFQTGEQIDDNFFGYIESKLERLLGSVKENNLIQNQENITNNRSYNNFSNTNINHNFTNNQGKNECLNLKDELLDLLNKLMHKNALIKAESEKMKKAKEEIKKQKEKIKNNEAIIQKEKLKLENEIKNFKKNRSELENKNNHLSQQSNKYTNDLNKLNLDKEVFEFEKNTFFKINFMLNTGKNLDNAEYAKVNEIKDIRKKLSINNLSLPTTNFTGNSSGSFTSKIIAKGNSQKTSMDVKKEIPAIENSILRMKRDNSADIAINSKKKNQISNVDENILHISSNNLLTNYGSNSVNKNNFSHNYNINNTNNNISNYVNPQNNSINNFTSNIISNLNSLQNMINSPKENNSTNNNINNSDKKNPANNASSNNVNVRKINLSNSNLNSNNNFNYNINNINMHSGSYTTKNKSNKNNLISETPNNHAHQASSYNVNNTVSNNNNIYSNVNTVTNFNSNQNINNDLNNTSNAANHKSVLNISSNQTGNKFYTPIAQIDLNRNKHNLSKMNLVSPKGEKAENRLLDSLDGAAYLSNTHNKPNVILLSDKRFNFKFKRAGSDDKPKNTSESKRIGNLKGNLTGSGLAAVSNSSIPIKDKDRKYSSKLSVDRQLKGNKDNNGLSSTLSSKLDLVKIDVNSNANANANGNKYNSRLAKKK